MKKAVIGFVVFTLISLGVYAQNNELNKNFGLGFQLVQYQNDFGLGFNMTSPYFLYNRLAAVAKGNLMWNEHIDNSAETTWSNYSNVSLGIKVFSGNVGQHIRLYGEGGVLIIQPSSSFSSKNSELGGYGLFGFEFFMNEHGNYFIEIGGIGTGAVADKIALKPFYSNGLLLSTGFRFQF